MHQQGCIVLKGLVSNVYDEMEEDSDSNNLDQEAKI